MTAISPQARRITELLNEFRLNVPGARHALVVSVDGLLMAMSEELDRTTGDRLGAVVAGLSSLAKGTARELRAGAVRQAMVEMDSQILFLMAISDGSVLGVVTEAMVDVGFVGYEMAVLVGRSEHDLTPQLVAEMRAGLPVTGATRAAVG